MVSNHSLGRDGLGRVERDREELPRCRWGVEGVRAVCVNGECVESDEMETAQDFGSWH